QNNIFLIPQVAVFELQGKKLVYVVGDDNKVNTKVIETNGTSDKDFIVTGGLKEGDKLVVEGVSKLQDGQEIIPDTSTSKANLSFVE
ncbi:MAG: efflux transporter periplasmic adaptor subunit, partial [Thalassobius sp.]|nr:efflux transporter periplasmic adaptor subunit [Thalassovita sp.]